MFFVVLSSYCVFTAFHSFLVVLRPVLSLFFYTRILNAFNLKSSLYLIELLFSSYFCIICQDVKLRISRYISTHLAYDVFHVVECDHQSETLCLSQLISFVFSQIYPSNL